MRRSACRRATPIAALSRLRNALLTATLQLDTLEYQAKIEAIHSLNRLLDLDLAMIEDSYEYHRMQLAQAAERQRSEVKFRNLVEAAACMILILREDLKIAYFSPFAEKLTGYRSESVAGKDYPSMFIEPMSQDEVRGRLTEALQGNAVHNYEASVVCSDASMRWLTWNALRIDDFDGQHAVLAVGHDITESRRAAQKLVQSERLAAIGQTITGLAHEGRNALQRINSCTEMLEFEVEENQAAIQLIHRLQAAQDDLRRLFDEVRNFAAPIQLERSPCRIPGIWHEAWDLLCTDWTGRDVAMVESTSNDLPAIDADRFRLIQVFRNLIENSLAACRDPVRINIACHLSKDDPEWMEIRVRDNGSGLEPAIRERVFQPFFTTKTKGTGLGMAIAQRIIEAHGGTIRVGEAETDGAEFVLTLPIGHT